MNIIKFKDIINPDDSLYNKKLKGKYAYWIQMKYAVPFEDMKHEGYVACENDINKLLVKESGEYPKPYGTNYWDVTKLDIHLIDIAETDKVNCINAYKLQNSFTSDPNITLEEIKQFRTWLAKTLLEFDKNNKGEYMYNIYDDSQIHVLEYYKNEMYDNIIKYLNEFGASGIEYKNTLKTCACHSTSDLTNLTTINTCDPILIYKKNIYFKMVEMFSDLNFWTKYTKEFILEFKSYIDNIIDCNLPLTKTSYISEFIDCGCNTNDDQAELQSILRRLSNSLEYISKQNTLGHKNYIKDALRDWAENLYELMKW